MVFAQLPRSFSALLLLNRRWGYNASLSLKPRRLFISLPEQRNETKKFAGCRSRAKIFTFFLKKKNSLRSNSFFFLTEKCKNFFTLFHGGRKLMKYMVQKNPITKFIDYRIKLNTTLLNVYEFLSCLPNKNKCHQQLQ